MLRGARKSGDSQANHLPPTDNARSLLVVHRSAKFAGTSSLAARHVIQSREHVHVSVGCGRAPEVHSGRQGCAFAVNARGTTWKQMYPVQRKLASSAFVFPLKAREHSLRLSFVAHYFGIGTHPVDTVGVHTVALTSSPAMPGQRLS